jgi:hypothetical protein
MHCHSRRQGALPWQLLLQWRLHFPGHALLLCDAAFRVFGVAFLLRCVALAAAWHVAVSQFPFEFGSMQSRNGSSGVGRCRVELSTIFLGMSMVETPAGFYTTIYKLQAQS